MIHLSARMRRRAVLGAGAAMSVAAVAGCGSGRAESDKGSGGTRKMRVLTGAYFNPWEAYLYVGIEKGWWAEVGIDLAVLPGEGTGRNLDLLAGGQAEFATLDPAAALIAYSKGTHTDWVLTCQLHANMLGAVMAKESDGISRLRHLEGQRVAALTGGTNTVLFPALGPLARFDPSAVELVLLELPFHPHLKKGNVKASLEFVPSRFAVEKALGEPLTVLPYADWLPDLPGLAMGVSRDMAGQEPELVRGFSQVALRSLTFSVEHPEESAEIFASHREEEQRRRGGEQDSARPIDREEVAAGLQDLAPYIRADEQELGQLSEVRYNEAISILTTLGVLEDSARVEEALDQVLAPDLYS